MKKKIILGVIGVVLVLLLVPAFVLGPYALQVRRFEPNPEIGFHAGYYLYVSPGAKELSASGKPVLLLIQPNNSGVNSDDPEVHNNDAWWTGFERCSIANELKVVLLVPAFLRPDKDWRILTHALDRDVLTTERKDLSRLDLQLLAMIDHARSVLASEGINVEEKVLIQGFSASGMFANRFTVLHPDRVLAVTAGSPGGWPIAPVSVHEGEALPYPAGIADLRELTGQPFDSVSYHAIPQLIYMGTIDDNDSVDFTDGWDEEAGEQVDRLFGPDPLSRWKSAEALYRSAGANATFLLIEGAGHDRIELQQHSTHFFTSVLARR